MTISQSLSKHGCLQLSHLVSCWRYTHQLVVQMTKRPTTDPFLPVDSFLSRHQTWTPRRLLIFDTGQHTVCGTYRKCKLLVAQFCDSQKGKILSQLIALLKLDGNFKSTEPFLMLSLALSKFLYTKSYLNSWNCCLTHYWNNVRHWFSNYWDAHFTAMLINLKTICN